MQNRQTKETVKIITIDIGKIIDRIELYLIKNINLYNTGASLALAHPQLDIKISLDKSVIKNNHLLYNPYTALTIASKQYYIHILLDNAIDDMNIDRINSFIKLIEFINTLDDTFIEHDTYDFTLRAIETKNEEIINTIKTVPYTNQIFENQNAYLQLSAALETDNQNIIEEIFTSTDLTEKLNNSYARKMIVTILSKKDMSLEKKYICATKISSIFDTITICNFLDDGINTQNTDLIKYFLSCSHLIKKLAPDYASHALKRIITNYPEIIDIILNSHDFLSVLKTNNAYDIIFEIMKSDLRLLPKFMHHNNFVQLLEDENPYKGANHQLPSNDHLDIFKTLMNCDDFTKRLHVQPIIPPAGPDNTEISYCHNDLESLCHILIVNQQYDVMSIMVNNTNILSKCEYNNYPLWIETILDHQSNIARSSDNITITGHNGDDDHA